MAEGNRSTRLPQSNIPWSLQQIHRNSQSITSNATQRIQDLQYYVVQGLSPLINSASMRPLSNSLNNQVPNTRHSMEFVSESRSNTFRSRVDQENVAQDYVIDMDGDENQTTEENRSMNNNSTNQNSQEQQNPTNNRQEPIADIESLRNTPEFQMILSFSEKYIPFFSILLMKLMFDHKLGIVVFIGLFVTFYHANSVVKREVAKQNKRHLLSLSWVFLNLIMCIIIIYSVLAEDRLAYALVFIPPYVSPISIWDVLWVVTVTDFVIRMLTIITKSCIVAIPSKLIQFHKKGKHYLFVEHSSQLYRTISPMQHWLYFFSESYNGPSKLFGVILSAAYLIFKCKSILHKAKLWRITFIKVLQSKTYGVSPSSSQIKDAGDACPICQDDYKSPSMLQCKHIFCEDCVALWFDRERTCPICRAQIADDPSWRDGSTSLALQIF